MNIFYESEYYLQRTKTVNKMNLKTKNIVRLIIVFLILLSGETFSQKSPKGEIYDARTKDWEILTPKAGQIPRINGPKIYGAGTHKQFIYRIPCEGSRPVRFTAKGLPEGLLIDSDKGIITGVTPDAEGIYNVTFTASNNKGSVSRDFKLVIGEKIALTPPMGWNSWGGHMLFVGDELMRRVADIMVEKGLADVGFQYVSIDDCWMRIDPSYYESRKEMYSRRAPGYPFEKVVAPPRDDCGRILPNSYFPDMKKMTDYIHSYGLKAGIYSGPGPLTCQLYTSSFGYEETDARQFADWGFDLLKYDMCSYRDIMSTLQKALPEKAPEIGEIGIWYPMTEYLAKQNRDILYNLCQYGRQDPWLWAPKINIQTWRTGGDLNHNVSTYFKEALRIIKEYREYSKPGQWNDPDFMYIGKIHDAKNKMAPPAEIPLTSNQRYQYVSLWSMICAPYFFSGNMDDLSDFTVGLLRNADIANVNQDELGHVAEIIHEDENQIVLLKKLADGGMVAGLFNLKPDSDQIITLKWDEIGLCCERAVRDLWRQKNLGTLNNGIAVNISPNGCAILSIY
jgi:alpha-galactosidase